MFPCRKCIVRACCTQTCEDFKKMRRVFCDVYAPLTFTFIAMIITAAIVYFHITLPREISLKIFRYLWGSGWILSIAVLRKELLGDNGLVLCVLFFGPIIGVWALVQTFLAKYAKGDIDI